MNLLNLLPIAENLQTFFAYTTALSIAILFVSSLILALFKGPISRLHGSLFGIKPEEALTGYFNFLGNFKMAALILFIIPYFTLLFMAD